VLKADYEKFQSREAEILVVGQHTPDEFARMWRKKSLTFIGLPDYNGRVAGLYQQKVHLIKLGRMPALFVIGKDGAVKYSYYSKSMGDIPENEELFRVIDDGRK
jgi:peroxiredoxin Q/BCP